MVVQIVIDLGREDQAALSISPSEVPSDRSVPSGIRIHLAKARCRMSSRSSE